MKLCIAPRGTQISAPEDMDDQTYVGISFWLLTQNDWLMTFLMKSSAGFEKKTNGKRLTNCCRKWMPRQRTQSGIRLRMLGYGSRYGIVGPFRFCRARGTRSTRSTKSRCQHTRPCTRPCRLYLYDPASATTLTAASGSAMRR